MDVPRRYEAAGIKMLPVVDKAGHSVIRQMLTYCSTLISVSLVPALLRMTGKVYLFGALVLGWDSCGLFSGWREPSSLLPRPIRDCLPASCCKPA